jgi:hypothetical protein
MWKTPLFFVDFHLWYVLDRKMKKENKAIFLFICAYNVWVISPSCPPPPLPYLLPLSLPPDPLNTQQKLFCPYL